MSTQVEASPERGGGREADGGVQSHRIRELEFMVPEFVERIRGSRWNRALPGGGQWNRALPGGSQWNRALPGGSQWNRALLGGSRWVQAQPARTLRED